MRFQIQYPNTWEKHKVCNLMFEFLKRFLRLQHANTSQDDRLTKINAGF